MTLHSVAYVCAKNVFVTIITFCISLTFIVVKFCNLSLQMSVVSSRVSTISSILQSGVRAQILGQQNRVRFKLPNDLKIVLNNYETGVDRKSYEELICILRDTDVKVSN